VIITLYGMEKQGTQELGGLTDERYVWNALILIWE